MVVEIAGVLKRSSRTSDWGGPHARMAHLPADYVNMFGKQAGHASIRATLSNTRRVTELLLNGHTTTIRRPLSRG